jgi:cytoskeleton protein RodZ
VDAAPAAPVLDAGQVEELVEGAPPSAPEIGSAAGAQSGGVQADGPALPATDTSPGADVVADDESEVPQLPDLGQGPNQAAVAEPATPDVEPVAVGETAVDPSPDAASTSAATPEDVPATGRVFGQAQGDVRVVLRAVEDSWIEIRDDKGTLWASRVLRRGDVFRAPNSSGLVMQTGNAGGLVVSLDGKDLAPLGAKSQVMRNIALTPEALTAR